MALLLRFCVAFLRECTELAKLGASCSNAKSWTGHGISRPVEMPCLRHGCTTQSLQGTPVQVVLWMRERDAARRSSMHVTRLAMLLLRAFMLAMLVATVSRLPGVPAATAWLMQQPVLHELKKLQPVAAPLLGVLGFV